MRMNSIKGFTLAELLISLALLGMVAVFVLPQLMNSGGSQDVKIAESLKQDVQKAFQLSASSSGAIQNSAAPSDVIKKALNLGEPEVNATNGDIDYKTQNGWTVSVPQNWTITPGQPDSVVVTISPKNSEQSYTTTVYRDNSAKSDTSLATVAPVVINGNTNLTGGSVTETTVSIRNPVTPPPAPPNIDLSNVNFIFKNGSTVVNLSDFDLTVQCPPSLSSALPHNSTNIQLAVGLSNCSVTAMGLSDGTDTYTANAKSFGPTVVGDQTVEIPVTKVPGDVNITFRFTDSSNATVNLTQYKLDIICPTTGAFTITNPNSLVKPILSGQTGCTVTASNLRDATTTYTATTAPLFNTDVAKTVTIVVGKNVNVTFQFKDSAGTVLTLTQWALDVNCPANQVALTNPTLIASLKVSQTCSVSARNLVGSSGSFTPASTTFIIGTVNKTVPITLYKNVNVTFKFVKQDGTTVVPLTRYNLNINCPSTNSAALLVPSNLTANLRAEQSGCTVSPTGLSDGTNSYSAADPQPTFSIAKIDKTISITVYKNVNVRFRFRAGGTAITMTSSTGNVTCAPDNYPLSSALNVTLGEGRSCKATFINLVSSSNISYKQVTVPQSFTATDANPIWIDVTRDFGNIKKVDIFGRDENNQFDHNIYRDYGRGDTTCDNWLTAYTASQYGFLNACGGTRNSTVANKSMSAGQFYAVDPATGGFTTLGITGSAANQNALLTNSVYYFPDGSSATRDEMANFFYVRSSGSRTIDYFKQYLFGLIAGYNAMYPTGPIGMIYTDPASHTKYQVNSGWFFVSPIKLSLNGEAAVVTDAGGFNFDSDGFAHNIIPVMKTSGGLSADEAWLVMDRGHSGIFKNGVVDADAVFGDHYSKFTTGYEDLASEFAASIETDSNNNRYISLKPLPWYQELWRAILKFFHMQVAPDPYTDLKLLTADNHIIDANTIVSRLDVSYKNVKEFSPSRKNAILQRAKVYYTSGKIADGADLWFTPQLYHALKKLQPGEMPFKKKTQ